MSSIGWSSVFYIFGSLGVLWFAFWVQNASSGPTEDTIVSEEEKSLIVENTCDQVRLTTNHRCDEVPSLCN